MFAFWLNTHRKLHSSTLSTIVPYSLSHERWSTKTRDISIDQRQRSGLLERCWHADLETLNGISVPSLTPIKFVPTWTDSDYRQRIQSFRQITSFWPCLACTGALVHLIEYYTYPFTMSLTCRASCDGGSAIQRTPNHEVFHLNIHRPYVDNLISRDFPHWTGPPPATSPNCQIFF